MGVDSVRAAAEHDVVAAVARPFHFFIKDTRHAQLLAGAGRDARRET